MGRVEAADEGFIAVEVIYCPQAHVIDHTPLRLRAGAVAGEALAASGVLQRHGLDAAAVSLGVWGQGCGADQALRDRDRLELYRLLQVDPKEARRLRDKSRRDRRLGGLTGHLTGIRKR
jgi:putative ubiquitin-RnfH superfamily antitoxin RatB of RatAB toxin-antitoxin module